MLISYYSQDAPIESKVAVMCVEYLPNQDTDVKLATIERGSGGDGSSNCDLVVGLHETRAKQVVASRCLIRIRLCPLKLQPSSLDTNYSSCISLLLHMYMYILYYVILG